MALLIKSDTVSTKNLGNSDGLRGPQDWNVFYDFENEKYLERYNGEIRNVPDATKIGNTHNVNGTPKTKDRNGVVSNSPANSIRTWLTKDGRFGALTEDARSNYFLNSNAPVTQAISLPASSNDIIVSCIGAGTITVTGTNLNETTTLVSQDNPQKVTVKSATAHTISVTCAGQLSHVQVEIAGGFASATSPITTTSAAAARGKDSVFMNNDVFARALEKVNSTKDFTVVVQLLPYDLLQNSQTKSEAHISVYSVATSDYLISSVRKTALGTQQAMSSYATALAVTAEAIDTQEAKSQKWGMVSALRMKNKTMSTATNGVVGANVVVPTNFVPTVFYMGIGHASPIGRAGAHGLVLKALVFDRALTDDEMKEITKSWN